MLITVIGFLAASLTSLSYIPQVKKALPRGSTDDLSLKTLGALAIGLALWIVYGVFRKDLAIVLANGIGLSLVLVLIAFKLRDLRHPRALLE
jgi:MtN3 and saliva related transmembrane protein